jgi:hypothetical protein
MPTATALKSHFRGGVVDRRQHNTTATRSISNAGIASMVCEQAESETSTTSTGSKLGRPVAATVATTTDAKKNAIPSEGFHTRWRPIVGSAMSRSDHPPATMVAVVNEKTRAVNSVRAEASDPATSAEPHKIPVVGSSASIGLRR